MPLIDHFRPPLSDRRHWESFHSQWASAIVERLNEETLPEGYFAEAQVHVGSRVEVDVATFEEKADSRGRSSRGIAVVEAPVWIAPAPSFAMRTIFPDSLEVLIYHGEGGPKLVAAVELVSPGNKDRDDARRAFAAKCASYLQQGVGLVVVDVVTSRRANLHNDLVMLLEGLQESCWESPHSLSCIAYRPARSSDEDRIDVWTSPLELGHELPTLPLPIGVEISLPLDLEASYSLTRRRSRLT